ncbi:MAG: NAD(P)/FAD-dependent oxidoreductase [Gemmatimonadaceae bacterium]
MTTHQPVDITIIGGGPTGLFARFYAGMRGVSAQIIDALPQLGGQLTALYPEKYIFDVAGFSKVLAKDLVKSLAEQSAQFGGTEFLNQRVIGLDEGEGEARFTLQTDQGSFPTRSIVIAAGIGAFSPRRLPQPVAEPWYGRGVYDVVLDPSEYVGKKVIIIGGGDSAFDWAQQLTGRATHVTLAHRSDRFRAHGATVADVRRFETEGKVEICTFHELFDVTSEGDRLTGVVLRHTKTKETRAIPCDAILPMLGYVSNLGELANWGLTFEKDEIVVNSLMETGRPGIYAAGDVTTFPGKLKLIAAGFGEAATAVNQAVHWAYPEKKVAPGHSSNMAIFGQTAD